jgi:O-antigen/teichoic acid export membrane protein
VASYVFLLAAGRILGSDDYGSLAALLGLLAVVLLPAAAVQMAVAREISRLVSAGLEDRADAFAASVLRVATLATLPLLAVALALAVPLAHLLKIDSAGIVALAQFTLVTAFVFPVTTGILQGRQRFHALAVLYVLPLALRVALFAVVAAAGFKLGGAILATVTAAVVGTIVSTALVRDEVRRGLHAERPSLRPFLRYLAPVAGGLVGIALLTHIDILVVKARFSGDDAGAYGAASAFARVAFFLPTTILTVLFPRTAARQARGEETEDILGRSLLATAAFCGALALFYAAAGVGLVMTTFGHDFAEGGAILAPFALAIGLFSLANILVGYDLSRGETRYAWIVAAGVFVQVAVLALLPSTLHALVWANVAVGVALLLAHELFVGSSVHALRAGLRHLRGAASVTRAVLPEAALVLFGSIAFVCVLFWPLVIHMGSTIIGSPGSDATGTVAGIWQNRHESGYHLLGSTHHTLSGAPFGWDETNALNVQVMLAYYPTYLVAHVIGDVAAFNLVTLAGYVLSGATMYVLVRYLGCSRLVAAWAAMAFIVFPWHIARAEHASLLQLEVLALLLLALVTAARRPTWIRFALVGVATLACWLMSGYFGPMAVVTTAAFAVGVLLTSGMRRGGVYAIGTTASAFLASAVVAIAAYTSNTNSAVGLSRAVTDLSIFGLRPYELVIPPTGNLVLGDRVDAFWATHRHGSNATETTNYLGWLTLALALSWLVVAWRRWGRLTGRVRAATAGLTAAFVAGLAFAAPSPLALLGHEVQMPARLLWEVVPAFRVTSRWDPLLMAAVVPLAALGLQASRRAVTRAGRRILPGALLAAAFAFSFLELTIHPAQARFRTTPMPPEYAAVARTPRGILAEYPLGYADVYRLWQTRHGRALLNGAPPDTAADYARLVLLDPADAGTAEKLAFLGVTAIAIHPNAHVDAEVAPRDPAGRPGYKLIGRFADGASVWQVVAPPAPALATLPGGFAPPRRVADLVGYPFVSSSGAGLIELSAKQPATVQLSLEAVPPQGAQRTFRIADSKSEHSFPLAGTTHIAVTVQVPRGVSQLVVKTDPAPTSEADAIVISAPLTASTSAAAVLHADLVSPNPGL